MCSNLYYGIKDTEPYFSFSQAKWLTPSETIHQLQSTTSPLDSNLIFPNELILDESKKILDILLLAKYRTKYGNIKLKSILLTQLKSQYSDSNTSTCNLWILRLTKDAYYWCQVDNNLIPKYSLRAGYDQISKQFSYIGRMKASSLLSSSLPCEIPIRNAANCEKVNNNVSNTISSLIGTLTHFYEYIPAIVLQLHDLTYLDERKLVKMSQTHQASNIGNKNQTESFWKRLRTAVLSNASSKDMDFNFISSNYEVLCLKKQPITLKQCCILKLNELNDDYFEKKMPGPYKSFLSLPNSIRNLIWPAYLMPGQCLIKQSRMRSSNGQFELNLNQEGNLKFMSYSLNSSSMSKKIVTYEKNLESLLVSQSGVYLIYDNNQAMRKPYILYAHTLKPLSSADLSSSSGVTYSNTLLDNSLGSSYVLELSDSGYLRVIVQNFVKNTTHSDVIKRYKSNAKVIILLDLNEFFKPKEPMRNSLVEKATPKLNTTVEIDNCEPGSSYNLIVNIRIIISDFKEFPMRLFNIIRRLVKSVLLNVRSVQSARN